MKEGTRKMKQASFKILLLFAAALAFAACSIFGGPGKATKNFYYALEAGKIDEAMKMVSTQTKSTMGEQKLRGVLSDLTRQIKQRGGIKSIEITKEEITGEIADVAGTVKYKDGMTESFNQKLFKEDGDWKFQ
jgi:hypothetical protein